MAREFGTEREVPVDPSRLPLGESRARVLEALQTAGVPLGVVDVARRVGLHPNTTRFHLDGLVEQGRARRTSEDRETPGRPRALYTAAPDGPPAGQRSYRLLARILADYLAARTADPTRAALAAGDDWGHLLVDRPKRRVGARAAERRLTEALDDIGFAPEPVVSGGRRQIHLHRCPFRELAEENRDVVCTVHLGLMRGLLGELEAPLAAARLEPFVEPDLCIAHLEPATGDGT